MYLEGSKYILMERNNISEFPHVPLRGSVKKSRASSVADPGCGEPGGGPISPSQPCCQTCGGSVMK